MVHSDTMQSSAFVLYGAGRTGKDVLAFLRRHGKTVFCFLDVMARPGMQTEGVPVYTPDCAPLDVSKRADIPVVVSVFNRGADVAEIVAALRKQGWERIVSFVEFHALHSRELGDRFWLTSPSLLEKAAERIAAVGRLWADDTSRSLYEQLLAARRSALPEDMPRPVPEEVQYFPSDVAGWLPDTPLRFVDCGAYDGDTLRIALERNCRLEAYAAFEPDPANFQKLGAAIRTRLPSGVPGFLWPCAVSNDSALCSFVSGLGEGNHMGPDTVGPLVPSVALDDVLPGFRPNLIKMDIEGAEPAALLGARKMIERNRPRLAVCVYHCPEHLWSIPQLIADWGLGYRLHVRVHAWNMFEVVLYAVPEQTSQQS